MRLSVMVFGLVCVCALVIGVAAPVVQDDDDVRGAFLTSRPKEKTTTSGVAAKPSRRRPQPSGGSDTPNKPSGKTSDKPENSGKKPSTPSDPATPWAACRRDASAELPASGSKTPTRSGHCCQSQASAQCRQIVRSRKCRIGACSKSAATRATSDSRDTGWP